MQHDEHFGGEDPYSASQRAIAAEGSRSAAGERPGSAVIPTITAAPTPAGAEK